MVLVQLIWQLAPESPVTFRGPNTKISYGQRGRGDVFNVWQVDYENSESMFQKVLNFEPEAIPTIIQPPPETELRYTDDLRDFPDEPYPDANRWQAYIPSG